MTYVFISYASEDSIRAKKLAEALKEKGVVVLWSKHSVISEWVKSEAQVAVERGTLVPALIDAVKPPLEFRRKQTVDLVDWDGDLGHLGLDTLHRGISAHVARESPTQPPSDPARSAIPLNADVFRLIETPVEPRISLGGLRRVADPGDDGAVGLGCILPPAYQLLCECDQCPRTA